MRRTSTADKVISSSLAVGLCVSVSGLIATRMIGASQQQTVSAPVVAPVDLTGIEAQLADYNTRLAALARAVSHRKPTVVTRTVKQVVPPKPQAPPSAKPAPKPQSTTKGS